MRGGSGARGSGRGGTGAKDSVPPAAVVDSDVIETKLVTGAAVGELLFIGLNGDFDEGYELEAEGLTNITGGAPCELLLQGGAPTWGISQQNNASAPAALAGAPTLLTGSTWMLFHIRARRSAEGPFYRGGYFQGWSFNDVTMHTMWGSFLTNLSQANFTTIKLGDGGATRFQPGFRATLRRKRFSV